MKSQEILAFFLPFLQVNTTLKQCGRRLRRSYALLPYKITLLSNNVRRLEYVFSLCTLTKLHYSQTIQNSVACMCWLCSHTKLHYSQTTTIVQWQWFVLYTHTNLHYSQTIISSTLSLVCFAPIQNYTTLKLALIVPTLKSRFVPIQNYTTLKRTHHTSPFFYGFTPIQNYTTLKQIVDGYVNEMWLYTHTKLHYSQTSNI